MKAVYSILLFTSPLFFCQGIAAQQLFPRPKNQSQFAARILHEQKTWQQKQLPKNSVQYQLSNHYSYPYNRSTAQKISVNIPPAATRGSSALLYTGKTVSSSRGFPFDHRRKLPFNRRLLVIRPLEKNN